MKLSDIAKKPTLTEVTIDDADIVEQYGEALTFWTWDRQPMDVFLKLASLDQKNTSSVISAVRELILDSEGKQILTDSITLPTQLMMRVISLVVDRLGK
jgi:hypothetical protein